MVGRLLRAHDHVLVVRKHDHVACSRGLDRRDDVGRRRVHGAAAVDDARAKALVETLVAVAGHDRDHVGHAGRRVGDRFEQALRALLCLLVHVRDLDPADRPARGCVRERPPRVVGVQMHLERGAVADHQQRVAERVEVVLELVGV